MSACIRSRDGTAPQARGRPQGGVVVAVDDGNSPAGAGTTSSPTPPAAPPREQPRRRGDDTIRTSEHHADFGTAPQARGRRGHLVGQLDHGGNSPAGAGTTSSVTRMPSTSTEQPRRRGDDSIRRSTVAVVLGTAPQARGRRAWGGFARGWPGNSPAGAGTTARNRESMAPDCGTAPQARGRRGDRAR